MLMNGWKEQAQSSSSEPCLMLQCEVATPAELLSNFANIGKKKGSRATVEIINPGAVDVMDWNLKTSSWDLSEFEHEAISNTDAFDKSIGIGDHTPGGDFSIDLKLGRVGNSSGDSIEKLKQPGVPKMGSSPSGPTKRPRANNNGTHAASCLVDGCNSDLSNCRDYHRRHKVCELHSKTPQVTINGQKQRFCQQCSRFHSLDEFDEGKRSCRKRLDGHNRRRRKPQPDPFTRAGNFLSSYQGSQLFPFSSTHVYPSTTVVNPTWSGTVNSEVDTKHYILHQQIHLPDKHNLFHGSSPSSYKGVKQFPFMHVENPSFNNLTPPETSVCQPLLRTFSMSESNAGDHSMFCDRLTTQVQDSMDCALSLLSSSTQASENHIVQTDSMHLVQPINSSLHDHNLSMDSSILLSSGRSASDVHCAGMFDMRSGDSSGNKTPQTLPFSWQ